MLHQAHAATGLLAGSVFVAAYDLAGMNVPPEAYPLYAVACAGWALAPDLDHDQSMFTRSGGPVTRSVAEALQWLARAAYRHTRRECDPPIHVRNGEHRGLLHTLLFAVLVGALLTVVTMLVPWLGPVVLILVLSPALRSLAYSTRKLGSPKSLKSRFTCLLVAAVITVETMWLTDLTLSGPLFGAVAALGMLTHIAGDGATNSGSPWFGGFPHRCAKHRQQHRARRCARWAHKHNVPKRWIARAGAPREKPLTGVCLVLSVVLITIGFVHGAAELAETSSAVRKQ